VFIFDDIEQLTTQSSDRLFCNYCLYNIEIYWLRFFSIRQTVDTPKVHLSPSFQLNTRPGDVDCH